MIHTKGIYGPACHSVSARDTLQSNIVFLHTPMHTATMFIYNMLQRHSKYGSGLSWNELINNSDKFSDTWASLIEQKDAYRMANNKFHVIQMHVHVAESPLIWKGEGTLFSLIAQSFSRTYPTLITARDPVSMLITHTIRNRGDMSKKSQEKRIASTKASGKIQLYAALMAERGLGLHLSVEVVKSPQERQDFIKTMFKYLGLSLHNETKIHEAVEHWEKLNTIVKTEEPLKKAFQNGDLAYLIKNLPGMKSILNNRDTFIPYLTNLGYKDLFWWEGGKT